MVHAEHADVQARRSSGEVGPNTSTHYRQLGFPPLVHRCTSGPCLGDSVSSYWANFAKTGDPNGKGLPQWAAVNDKPNTTMQIGDEMKMIPLAATPARVEIGQQYFAHPRPA